MIAIKTEPLPVSPQRDASSATLRWRTYSATEIDAAMQGWRRLAARLDSQSITCSPFWTHCWITHYGPVTPFRIVAAEEQGELRGIVLVTEGIGRKVGPFPVRTRHLGTAGEAQLGSPFVEYNRLLIQPGYESRFLSGLSQHLGNDLGWDQLHLDGFEQTELTRITDQFSGADVLARESKYCNLGRIRKDGGDILAALGKSTRSNIRRKLRDYGELECTWAESVEQADQIFAEMVNLHQARWQSNGQPGAFSQGRFLRFQHDVMVRGLLEHRVVLFRVRHQGETVGCLMLLADGPRLLDYLSGFAPFETKASPGLITHYLCMEQALKRGFDAYDFLIGDKRHKDNLSTDTATICWATLNRPTFKMRMIETLQQAKRRWRQFRSPKTQPVPDVHESW